VSYNPDPIELRADRSVNCFGHRAVAVSTW
jgi:hypothetical protein